uniref:Putative tropomyosin n=1 Tax=Anopheles braziliensis TaxID=58242 RepID=A0A2M3Z9U7_9DIPT
MEDKLFTSVEEECRHWKERFLKVSQERDDAQREFDDFTAESRQLEAELEMTVEQQEKKIRDLNQMVTQLHGECESYKRKLQYNENETSKLDSDYRQLANENEKLKVYIRELEQKNDDLERANRVASESVVEFESMLNQAYEKNALLELEVDEKERMQIKLQRLMDEARDLKQELKVRTLKPGENGEEEQQGLESAGREQSTTSKLANDSNSATGTTQLTNICLDANGSFSAEPSKLEIVNNNLNATKQRSAPSILAPLAKLAGNKLHDLGSPLREAGSEEGKTFGDGTKGSPFLPAAATPTGALIIERNGNTTTSSNSTALVPLQATTGGALNPPMAPSDRVSTLNIVADLLRRLDNMEAKLKAWKIRKPSSRTTGGGGTSTGGAGTGSQRSLYSHNHHHHHHAHHPNPSHQPGGQPSSYQSHHHHHNSGSNHSLNSLVSSDGTTGASGAFSGSVGNCCSSSAVGNVQLHSYQPSTITIGTQTSQQATAVATPAKTELLLRTSK